MTTKKEKAQKKIEELVQAALDAIEEATEIADEHEIEFKYEPTNVGTYTPRHLEWAASTGCEWETSDEWSEGRWSGEHIDWQSSSMYC